MDINQTLHKLEWINYIQSATRKELRYIFCNGDPNGYLAGNTSDVCRDITMNQIYYVCVVEGDKHRAIWVKFDMENK